MVKTIKKTNKTVTKEIAVAKKTPVKKEVVEKVKNTKKLSKMVTIHLIGLVVLLALIGGCFYKYGIVATVNGQPIYRWTYIAQLQKQDKQTVLDQMIQDTLIMNEAKNKGIVIDQKVIDDAMSKIEEQVKAQGTTLDEALKTQSMTRDELVSQIRTQKIAEALASPSAEITQDQITAFLKENKAYLPTGKTDIELQILAKEQLETQAKNTALGDWFTNLKSAAKIIYR